MVRSSNGKLNVDQRSGEVLLQVAVPEKGRPKWIFLKQKILQRIPTMLNGSFLCSLRKRKVNIQPMLQQ
jgi:hypothetical protein